LVQLRLDNQDCTVIANKISVAFLKDRHNNNNNNNNSNSSGGADEDVDI
jgi:hypothetical protein